MLILKRGLNERVKIGENIWVIVTGIENGKVKLGFEAPSDVKILRQELLSPEDR
jgi:carbon storage regulator